MASPSPLRESDLPTDVAVLRAMVMEREALMAAHATQLEASNARWYVAQSEVLHFKTWVEKLKLEIAVLKRLRFGRSSEQLDAQIAQLELIVDDLSTEQAAHEAKAPVTRNAAPSDDEPVESRCRKLLAEHLPREAVVHAAACTCPSCGSDRLRLVGEDVSEQLEFVPEHFKVIRHVRPKYSCLGCQAMVQAPAPSRPIAKSPVAPGLLAHVLVSKYADHLPLYRQSEIYARQGVEIARSTLADWVGGAHHLLAPLVQALHKHVMAAPKLHADDTPVPVLQPGRKTTKQGRLWAYVRDDRDSGEPSPQAAWFTYTGDRKGIHPQQHLKDFAGIVQADGYAGYKALFEPHKDGTPSTAQEAACWAHARRKFFELYQATGSPQAKVALERIARLYAVEAHIRGSPPEHRRQMRQTQAMPVLTEHHHWLRETLQLAGKKSALGLAIHYSLARWAALMRYASDGRIEMDNNIVERQIRPIALGKKNWLFAGSDAGGERAASIYSLMNTAKMHGLNPQHYLRTVFERIADHPINRIDALLPWNLAAELASNAGHAVKV
jgi:transposase